MNVPAISKPSPANLLKNILKSEREEEIKGIDKKIGELEKSNRSYDKLIAEHEAKLDSYKNNPEGSDNKDKLKNVSPEQRKNIILGRIKKLVKEIQKFRDNILKNKEQIQDLNKQKDKIKTSNNQ
jgi:chromosome segregation ATPase